MNNDIMFGVYMLIAIIVVVVIAVLLIKFGKRRIK